MTARIAAPLLLLATIALAARYSTGPKPEPRAEWEKDRVYRPPIVTKFAPAPGYMATWVQPRERSDVPRLEIRHGAELVYQVKQRGHGVYVGEKFRDFDPIARDVDGNGIPDLVITEELGTWAYETHVVELGRQFRAILKFKGVFPAKIRQDGAGALLVETRDSTFSGWRYCHADSPYPGVVLRLQSNRLVLAPEHMRREPRPDSGPEGSRLIASLTRRMTETLYTGHPDLCLKALRCSGLCAREQAEFLRDFKARLRTSPWAAQLADNLPG